MTCSFVRPDHSRVDFVLTFAVICHWSWRNQVYIHCLDPYQVPFLYLWPPALISSSREPWITLPSHWLTCTKKHIFTKEHLEFWHGADVLFLFTCVLRFGMLMWTHWRKYLSFPLWCQPWEWNEWNAYEFTQVFLQLLYHVWKRIVCKSCKLRSPYRTLRDSVVRNIVVRWT